MVFVQGFKPLFCQNHPLILMDSRSEMYWHWPGKGQPLLLLGLHPGDCLHLDIPAEKRWLSLWQQAFAMAPPVGCCLFLNQGCLWKWPDANKQSWLHRAEQQLWQLAAVVPWPLLAIRLYVWRYPWRIIATPVGSLWYVLQLHHRHVLAWSTVDAENEDENNLAVQLTDICQEWIDGKKQLRCIWLVGQQTWLGLAQVSSAISAFKQLASDHMPSLGLAYRRWWQRGCH